MNKTAFRFSMLLSLTALFLLSNACRLVSSQADDDRDLLPPAGYNLRSSVSLENTPDLKFTTGWHDTEADTTGQRWRWMARRSETQLRNRGADMKLRIEGWTPTQLLQAPPTLRVSLNGKELERFPTPTGGFTKSWDVPIALQGTGETSTLVMEISDVAPVPNETRELAFSLNNLIWKPLKTTP
ncbi:MAG: hypothetical protein ACKV2V_10730 [Blastocatellia bacterium]